MLEMAVLTNLALHGNSGLAYPSVQTIAGHIRASERSVQRALRCLEAAGLIVPVEQSAGGRGKTSLYRLAIGVRPMPAKKTPTQGRGFAASIPDRVSENPDTVSRKPRQDVAQSELEEKKKRTPPSPPSPASATAAASLDRDAARRGDGVSFHTFWPGNLPPFPYECEEGEELARLIAGHSGSSIDASKLYLGTAAWAASEEKRPRDPKIWLAYQRRIHGHPGGGTAWSAAVDHYRRKGSRLCLECGLSLDDSSRPETESHDWFQPEPWNADEEQLATRELELAQTEGKAIGLLISPDVLCSMCRDGWLRRAAERQRCERIEAEKAERRAAEMARVDAEKAERRAEMARVDAEKAKQRVAAKRAADEAKRRAQMRNAIQAIDVSRMRQAGSREPPSLRLEVVEIRIQQARKTRESVGHQFEDDGLAAELDEAIEEADEYLAELREAIQDRQALRSG